MNDTPTPETDYSTQQLYGKKYVPARVARSLERERNKLREALRFIAEWGGRTLESEYGDIDCNGRWCAEQAKEALE